MDTATAKDRTREVVREHGVRLETYVDGTGPTIVISRCCCNDDISVPTTSSRPIVRVMGRGKLSERWFDVGCCAGVERETNDAKR